MPKVVCSNESWELIRQNAKLPFNSTMRPVDENRVEFEVSDETYWRMVKYMRENETVDQFLNRVFGAGPGLQ